MLNRIRKYTKICKCRDKQTHFCQLCTNLDSEDSCEFVKFRFFLICLPGLSIWQIQARSALSITFLVNTHDGFHAVQLLTSWPNTTRQVYKIPFVSRFSQLHILQTGVWQSDGATKQKTDSTLECEHQTTLNHFYEADPWAPQCLTEQSLGTLNITTPVFLVGDDWWEWFWVRCESRLGPNKSADKYQPCGS